MFRIREMTVSLAPRQSLGSGHPLANHSAETLGKTLSGQLRLLPDGRACSSLIVWVMAGMASPGYGKPCSP